MLVFNSVRIYFLFYLLDKSRQRLDKSRQPTQIYNVIIKYHFSLFFLSKEEQNLLFL